MSSVEATSLTWRVRGLVGRLHVVRSLLFLFLTACGGSSMGLDAGQEAGTDAYDATTETSAPDAGVAKTIPCGNTSCDLSQTVCCVFPPQGEDGWYSWACVYSEGCLVGQVTEKIACASAAHCGANQVCCLTLSQGTLDAECASACGSAAQLCASDSECTAGRVERSVREPVHGPGLPVDGLPSFVRACGRKGRPRHISERSSGCRDGGARFARSVPRFAGSPSLAPSA